MIDPRRSRTTWQAISKLPAAVVSTLGRSIRDFLWADLRKGLMSAKGLDRHTRLLAFLGLTLLLIAVIGIVWSDFWRAHSKLILMDTADPRGQSAPRTLIPFTLFLLAVAWSFVLTGVLHSHWIFRLLAVGAYVLNAIGWTSSIHSSGSTATWEVLGAAGAIVGVCILFLVRWMSAAKPAFEFPIVFGLVSFVHLLAQNHELRNLETFGVPVALAKINVNVAYLHGLVIPLLLLVGVDIAEFARRASRWTTKMVADRTPKNALGCILGGLFAWRLYVAACELFDQVRQTSIGETSRAYVGALIEVALVGAVFQLISRFNAGRSSISERAVAKSAAGTAVPLVLLYSLLPLATYFLLGIAMALPNSSRFSYLKGAVFYATDFLNGPATQNWYLLLSCVGILLAGVLLRYDKAAPALYLAAFGSLEIWDRLTQPDSFAARFHWTSYSTVEAWWIVAVAAIGIVGLIRKDLTRAWQSRLLFILLILTLMRQRAFIENPFSPFLGFTGVGFIAFALVWDLATRGAWANRDTAALPKTSRILLYLGWVLLAATVVNWAVTMHDLGSIQKLTGGTALLGFDRFGKPLIYVLFTALLLGHRKRTTNAAVGPTASLREPDLS